MTTTDTPAPDLAQVKQRQQKMWASGDFHAVAIDLYRRVVTIRSWSELRTTWAVWRRRPRSTEPSTSSPTGSS